MTAAREAGIEVVLVTARNPRWIGEIAAHAGVEGRAVCCNGAVVYDLAARRVVASHPLAMMLTAERSPSKPKALAAVSGAKPTSIRNATSCTTTENMAAAVQKNTPTRPQKSGVRAASRKVQPSPAFLCRASW